MKLNSKNKKKQNAIRKALLLGLPIASLMTGGCGKATADNGTPNGNEPEKQNVTEKETFSGAVKACSTPGIIYRPQ